MFELFDEIEKLIKQKYLSKTFINQTLNGNIDICINSYNRQVFIRTFESDDKQTDSVAILVLKDTRFAITDDIDLNTYEFSYEKAYEEQQHTNICFNYQNEFQLLANFNKVLEIVEHIATYEMI